jgi:hypothetical protein
VVVDVFFSCKCRVQYVRGAIVGKCVAFGSCKMFDEILKLFFAFAGYEAGMACRYREDIVFIMLN